ncbi:MAG: hypothetical protein HZA90_09055 [Verrucomicrobia bacterium]|nr:hypothetical protein [Verrucomicrobiota bacterium]
MEIHLTLPKASFLTSEALPLRVVMTNAGAAPVEVPDPLHEANWQPTFTLTGPGLPPPGRVMSARAAVLGDLSPSPDGVAPVLRKIEPGQNFERQLPLHAWLQLSAPGPYQIAGNLEWRGLTARSAPVSFTLEKLNPVALAVGVDEGVASKRQIPAAWLHQGGKGRRLYSAVFTEERPDLAEIGPPTATYLQETGADAADLLVPWTNYDRNESFHHWFAWREGSRLFARSLLAKEPLSLDLGRPPERLLRPALLPSSGDLNILVLSGDGRELLATRFAAPSGEGAPAPGHVLWRLPLPWPLRGARAALAPPSLPNARRAALVSQDADTLLLSLLDTSKADGPGELKTVRVREARALADSEPGLWIDAAGNSHVAVLCEKPHEDPRRKERSLALASANFAPDGTLLAPATLTVLTPLETAVKTATAAFAVAGAQAQLGWAALLENGQVIHLHSGGQPRRLENPPAVPLELLPRSQAFYLLTLDPAVGPRFVALQ